MQVEGEALFNQDGVVEPEWDNPFGPGKTTATLKFGRPGVVDVEEHDSHKLLVKFEVR